MTSRRLVPLAAAAAAVGALAAAAAGGAVAAPARTVAPAPTLLAALENQYVQVVKRVAPAVVQIETADGLGSGIVYDGKGHIVTNAHVVGTATTFTLLNGTIAGTGWNSSGYAGVPFQSVARPGSAVTVSQSTAMTAGAATLWAELWGS